MNVFKNFRLKPKLIVSLLLASLVPMIIMAYYSLSKAGSALEKDAFDQLSAVQAIKKSQITGFFGERIGDIKVLGDNPYTKMAVAELTDAFKVAKRKGLSGKMVLQDRTFKSVFDLYNQTFRYYMDTYGYYDVFLIDAEEGDIVYSAALENDYGTTLSRENHHLSKTWNKALQTGRPSLSDMEPYAPSNDAPAMFVASPIIDGGQTIGVLALQISNESINKIMQERSGMGETGESYLAGKDSDGSFSFRSAMQTMGNGKYIACFRPTIPQYWKTLFTENNKISDVFKDSAGKEVIVLAELIELHGIKWGIISKKDMTEVDIPVDELKSGVYIFATIFAIIAAIAAFLLAISITGGINKVISQIQSIISDIVNGQLDTRGDPDDVMIDFKEIVEGTNELIDAFVSPINVMAEYVDRIAKGDIPPKITDDYKGDFNEVKNNLNGCIDVMTGLLSETDQMITAIKDGKLDIRGDSEKFIGDWGKLVNGINELTDAFVGPINVMAEYVDRIAKGDIPPKITDDYKGDFIEVKNNLNSCIDVMNGLLKESTHLIDYVQNGKLDSQANAENFIGAWKELMQAINTMVKTFVGHIDAIPAPVMLVDKEFNIEFMNNSGANVLGSSRQQLIGQKCYNQFKTSDCNTANCAIAKAMATSQQTTNETDAHPNGMDMEISYTGAPVKNLKGEVVGGLEVVIDQTEIKNAQKKAAKVSTYQSNEVDKLTAVLNNMANGNMTDIYNIEKADDDTLDVFNSFQTIEENLNKTLNSINDTLGQVNVAVDQVASGSHQVSDSSQSLSQGATEQASSLEEITASITQIGGQTKQNAENATQANQISIGARESAENGNEQMKRMVNAMGDINESSSQISKIIKVIDEIAFQTNLLALNAAVEAARAGAHGKGFAVVADEVRNLAQRSADAAKETTELIEGSIKRVENGTTIANDTASALEEIVGNITKVTDLVGEIAGASNEQAKGVAQISTGLEQIDQVTQANTANAEESAAASEELSGQSNQLKQMIMRFNLKNGSGISLQSGQAEIKAISSEAPKKKRKKKAKQKPLKNDESDIGNVQSPEEVIVLDDDQFGKF